MLTPAGPSTAHLCTLKAKLMKASPCGTPATAQVSLAHEVVQAAHAQPSMLGSAPVKSSASCVKSQGKVQINGKSN